MLLPHPARHLSASLVKHKFQNTLTLTTLTLSSSSSFSPSTLSLPGIPISISTSTSTSSSASTLHTPFLSTTTLPTTASTTNQYFTLRTSAFYSHLIPQSSFFSSTHFTLSLIAHNPATPPAPQTNYPLSSPRPTQHSFSTFLFPPIPFLIKGFPCLSNRQATMLLTEEYVHAEIPSSSSERQKFIAAQEKSWLSLGWDRSRYSQESADTATLLLSAIAFSDHSDPVDLSLLRDDADSAQDPPSSDRGSRSRRDIPPATQKPSKKVKRASNSSVIPPKTQVACLDRSAGRQWVLGRVARYLSRAKKYEVLDDADGEEQIYRVFQKNIRVIPKKALSFDVEKKVLAVYPQTTVFYPARLVTRKGRNWVVEFDDEDDTEESKFKEVDGRFIITE